MTTGQRLQDEIQAKIRRLLVDEGMKPGDRIVESRLAQQLQISRTPVRTALDALAEEGMIRRVHNRGGELVRLPDPASLDAPAPQEDSELVVQISKDRNAGHLADQVTETEIMRRYEISRNEAGRLLERLADLGVVERKLGYGWRFVDTLKDLAARRESFQFRLAIEPAALLMPSFRLDPVWAEEIRARHQVFGERDWHNSHSVAFFEVNSAFHEGLARASGNRYILDAILRQNQLRRLLNYDWIYGGERVQQVCREHCAILDSLQAGDLEMAALQMRRHLEESVKLRETLGAR